MKDLIAAVLMVCAATPVFALLFRGFERRDRVYAWMCFGLHAAVPYVGLWVMQVIYGGNVDSITYFELGGAVARYISLDLADNSIELANLILQRDVHIPVLFYGAGTPTGTMTGIAAALMLVSDSTWAGTIAASLFSCSGQVAAYGALRSTLPAFPRAALAAGMLFVPSVVFWTSSFQKETIATAGLGWLVYATSKSTSKHYVTGVLLGIPAALIVAFSKPYILLPFAFSAGTWLYLARPSSAGFRIRPMRILIAASFTVVAVSAVGAVFPQFALDRVAEEAATRRDTFALIGGGSFTPLGPASGTGFAASLTLAPAALLSALFRPSLLDVRSTMMAVNAVEITAITALLVALLVRRGFASPFRRTLESPALAFCAVFTLTLGLAVGLTTPNLGSLSRYRSPMMPYYVTLLFALWVKKPRRRETVERPRLGPRLVKTSKTA